MLEFLACCHCCLAFGNDFRRSCHSRWACSCPPEVASRSCATETGVNWQQCVAHIGEGNPYMNLYAPATIFAQGSARQANHMQSRDVAEDHPGAGAKCVVRKTFASASNNICSECIMTVKVDTNEHSLLLILMRFGAQLEGICLSGIQLPRKFLLRKLPGMFSSGSTGLHNF